MLSRTAITAVNGKKEPPVDLNRISPHVRWVKKQTAGFLSGGYVDYDHVLTYVASGNAEFLIDGYRYPVAGGYLILLPPATRHVILVQPHTSFVEYVVHFDPVYNTQRAMLTGIGMAYFQEAAMGMKLYATGFGRSFHNTHAGPPDERMTEDRPWIVRFTPADRVRAERLLSDMLSLFAGSDPARAWLLKAALISLLAIAQHHGHPPDETPAERAEGWPTLHRALDCIHQRFSEPDLDNSCVAHAAGLTPNHLSRVFREHFGFTLRKYLTQVRIEQAKRMLADGSRSITDVADQTGFSGIHAFSRAFHRETGLTPSNYRAGK